MKPLTAALALGVFGLVLIFANPWSQTGAKEALISGEYSYRERTMPPQGAKAIVSLQDISKADAAAKTIAEQEQDLAGMTPPFSYELSVGSSLLDPRMRYALRVEIRGQEGRLFWTTDTIHMVDPNAGSQELGLITLVRVGATQPSGGADMLSDTEWQVVSAGELAKPENAVSNITFQADGKLSGRSGCNMFNGAYEKRNSAVTIGQLAVTRRACLSEINAFEQAFLEGFSGQLEVQVDGSRLILSGADGVQILAERK